MTDVNNSLWLLWRITVYIAQMARRQELMGFFYYEQSVSSHSGDRCNIKRPSNQHRYSLYRDETVLYWEVTSLYQIRPCYQNVIYNLPSKFALFAGLQKRIDATGYSVTELLTTFDEIYLKCVHGKCVDLQMINSRTPQFISNLWLFTFLQDIRQIEVQLWLMVNLDVYSTSNIVP